MSNDRTERQFFRPDVQRDVNEELTSHLEMRQQELVALGVPPGEAREQATRGFGNIAALARECRAIDEAWYREQRRASMWMDLRQDIAYALRLLRKAPAFTAVSVVTLAVGIGATTAIFSLANWALLRPVPGVERPGELQQIWTGARRGGGFVPSRLSYPNLHDIVPRLQTMTLAGHQGTSLNVSRGQEGARTLSGETVSASYFEVVGVRMKAGRPFTAQEDTPGSPAMVVVLSERVAGAVFGDPAAAIGQSLQVNGNQVTVIGVAGRGFRGLDRMSPVDVWAPGSSYPVLYHMPTLRYDDRKSGGFYELVARLQPGATRAQVDAELKSHAAWLAKEYPVDNDKFGGQTAFHVMGPVGTNPQMRQRLATMAWLMLGVSVLVMLISCSNVASLLVMRGVGRGGEVALRKALGAGRLRLLRQHLTEGAMLWLCGGALAVLIVWVSLRSADGAALLGGRGGLAEGVPLDWRVLAFAGALSLVVGLVFAMLPALRAIRVEAAEMLRQGSPSATPRQLRVGASLTVLQLALSLTLVVGALLLAVTIRNLSRVDVGFDPRGLYTFSVRPVGYTPEQAADYRAEFARQLALVPGVQNVAVSMRAPFVTPGMGTTLKDDETGKPLSVDAAEVMTASYFQTLGIPLRQGRLFTPEDLGNGKQKSRPVVIVTESLARRLFGTSDPLGRTVEYRTMGRVGKRFEIVGVVADARYASLIEAAPPMIYEPAALDGPARPSGTFVVRAAEGTDVAGAARRVANALNPASPIVVPMSMNDALGRAMGEWRVLANLMTALAAIAAVLAAVGLYGVVAFGVAARRREFGIRLALGAAPARVMALVVRGTAMIAVLGLVLGAGGAYAMARVLSHRLFGVTPFDPMAWTLSALVFVAIAGLASWIPARRAVSDDVTRSLRSL